MAGARLEGAPAILIYSAKRQLGDQLQTGGRMSYLLDYNPGTQQWGYPRRGGWQPSGTCIMHTAECAADNIGEDTSAEGCARMIANRADYGSYHKLVDSDSIVDMLPWEYEAWQDSQTNNWAVGISAAVRTTDWATIPADRKERIYRNLAACAADFVSYMQSVHGITVPLVRISGAQARAAVPGFCAHGDSGIARTDPGVDFDWDTFFRYTHEARSTPPQEDELSAAAELDISRVRQILESWEGDQILNKVNAIDQRTAELLETTKYVKGTDEDTLYEINEDDGTLRGISGAEWEVTGRGYRILPQVIINRLLGK